MTRAPLSPSYEPPLPCGVAPLPSQEDAISADLEAALIAGKDTTLLRQSLASVRAQRAAAIAAQGRAESLAWHAMNADLAAAGARQAAATRDALARDLAALQPAPFPPTAG